jgi:hypothetical protein
VGISEGGNGYDGGRDSRFDEVALGFGDEQIKQVTRRYELCDLGICLTKKAGFSQNNKK